MPLERPTENGPADHPEWHRARSAAIVVLALLAALFFVFRLDRASTGAALGQDALRPRPAPPPDMVLVPSGPFIMGSDVGDDDEKPRRTVELPAFYIDRFEVTNAQFARFDANHTYPPDKANCPVSVTWHQAAAYAAWAGKRLPTEPEWEKAARGTDGRIFPWGNYFDISNLYAWDTAEPVGKAFAGASPYGCLDIAGNAREWTADWYEPYPGNTVPCSAYGKRYKVVRGGEAFCDVSHMRCSHRYYVDPNTTISGYYITFRCAQSAP